MINHYHILDQSGRTLKMIPIGPPPLFEHYRLCRSTYSWFDSNGEWSGDRYDPNGPMCINAVRMEGE